MANKNIIVIRKTKQTFQTSIAPGTKGEDVLFGVACLLKDITKHEQKFQPDFTVDDLIGSIGVCLQHLDEKQ